MSIKVNGTKQINDLTAATSLTGAESMIIEGTSGTRKVGVNVLKNYIADDVVAVSGTSPTITAEANTMYVCGEVTSLSFTPCASGICDVRFTSGSTVTVLTIPNTVKFSGSFDPTSLETNKIYEINILDGIYGVVTSWEI